ncbi:MAG: methyltransferase domain-containing protein [Myxococcota bacterium]|nr:methyltransferase domain-containing protein [Myxococcota bacterium]
MPRIVPGSPFWQSSLLLVFTILFLGASGCTDLKRYAYAPPDRDGWQQPERVIELLELEPGDRVADIGAGGGYFTFKLADAVGKGGKIFAVDVDAPMAEALVEDVEELGYGNVEVVVAAPDDPQLEAGSMDVVFTSNTYHHIENRSAYFKLVAKALVPAGRVAIVEFRSQTDPFGNSHATEPFTIRSEMEAAGYRLVADYGFLERQAFLIFAVSE